MRIGLSLNQQAFGLTRTAFQYRQISLDVPHCACEVWARAAFATYKEIVHMSNGDARLELTRRQLELMRAISLHRARTSMAGFLAATFEGWKWNWHHRMICEALDDVAYGRCKRLLITTPPRVGKTAMVSIYLAAFLLGLRAPMRILAASYNATLAADINRLIQRVMETEIYARIFPNTKIAGQAGASKGKGWVRNTQQFEIVGRKDCSYRCGGVLGSYTGRGGDVLLLDDALKNRLEANSQTIRNRQWAWLQSTFLTRLEKNGSVIAVGTIWHEDDILSRIKRHQDNDGANKWRHINLPAIAEEPLTEGDPRKVGESIWPDRYPLHVLEGIRADVGEMEWASLYQARPTPAGGSVFRRQDFVTYKEMPACDVFCISVDLTFGAADGDYCVFMVLGRRGATYVVADMVRARLGFGEQKQALRNLMARWPQVRAVYIEHAANAAALIDDLRRDISGLVPVRVTTGKVQRAMAVAPLFEAKNVLLPDVATSIGRRITPDIMEELAVFPHGRFDDIVDALSLGLGEMRTRATKLGVRAMAVGNLT